MTQDKRETAMQPPQRKRHDSDASIDLVPVGLDESGRVPECRSDSVDLDADTATPREPRTTRCGDPGERELHRNPFPPEK
jgi:hypothetical protein